MCVVLCVVGSYSHTGSCKRKAKGVLFLELSESVESVTQVSTLKVSHFPL